MKKVHYHKGRIVKKPTNLYDSKLNGNHEKSWHKPIKPVEQAKHMENLAPKTKFNAKDIDSLLNDNKDTKFEDLIELENQKKIKKKDKMILENLRKKEKDIIEQDKVRIELGGLSAHVTTKYGKNELLCKYMEYFIKNNELTNLIKIYLKYLDRKYYNIFPDDLEEKYKSSISTMIQKVSDKDLIEFQFVESYHMMPPLDNQEFIFAI